MLFFTISNLKSVKTGTAHSSNSSLFCKSSIIGQLNVPAATAENEEQYTLSDITLDFKIVTLFFGIFLW